MDFPTSKIDREVSNALNEMRTNPDKYRRIMQALNSNKNEERSMTSKHSSACMLGVVDKDKLSKSHIDYTKLKSNMGKQFYNIQVMEAVACAVDSIFHVPLNSGLTVTERAKGLITRMHQIGGVSVEGYALAADVGDAKDLFVVKVPQDPKDDDLVHEQFIGMFALNKLRAKIPSFALVYGGFRCAPPQIDEKTREVISWCPSSKSGGQTVPYVVYENIEPSISAQDYVRTASPAQVLSCYLGVILPLIIAHHECKYTHYDLHHKNVLARDVTGMGFDNKKAFQIGFPLPGGNTHYLRTNRVMTIIDYGYSYAEVEGRGYGMNSVGLMHTSQFPDRDWPLQDAYKFLLFIMRDMDESGNRDGFALAAQIFRFFNKTEDPHLALKEQWDNKYILPLTNESGRYTLMDLLDYIMTNVYGATDLLSPANKVHADIPVLACNSYCSSFASVAADVVHKVSIPRTFPQYYEMSMMDPKAYVDKDFDYAKAREWFISSLRYTVDTLSSYSSKAATVSLTSDTVIDYRFLMSMKSARNNLFHLRESLDRLEYHIKIGRYIATKYNDRELIDMIRSILQESRMPATVFCKSLANEMENHTLLKRVIATENWKTAVMRDYRMEWIELHLDDILSISDKECQIPQVATSKVQSTSSAVTPSPFVLPKLISQVQSAAPPKAVTPIPLTLPKLTSPSPIATSTPSTSKLSSMKEQAQSRFQLPPLPVVKAETPMIPPPIPRVRSDTSMLQQKSLLPSPFTASELKSIESLRLPHVEESAPVTSTLDGMICNTRRITGENMEGQVTLCSTPNAAPPALRASSSLPSLYTSSPVRSLI